MSFDRLLWSENYTKLKNKIYDRQQITEALETLTLAADYRGAGNFYPANDFNKVMGPDSQKDTINFILKLL